MTGADRGLGRAMSLGLAKKSRAPGARLAGEGQSRRGGGGNRRNRRTGPGARGGDRHHRFAILRKLSQAPPATPSERSMCWSTTPTACAATPVSRRPPGMFPLGRRSGSVPQDVEVNVAGTFFMSHHRRALLYREGLRQDRQTHRLAAQFLQTWQSLTQLGIVPLRHCSLLFAVVSH